MSWHLCGEPQIQARLGDSSIYLDFAGPPVGNPFGFLIEEPAREAATEACRTLPSLVRLGRARAELARLIIEDTLARRAALAAEAEIDGLAVTGQEGWSEQAARLRQTHDIRRQLLDARLVSVRMEVKVEEGIVVEEARQAGVTAKSSVIAGVQAKYEQLVALIGARPLNELLPDLAEANIALQGSTAFFQSLLLDDPDRPPPALPVGMEALRALADEAFQREAAEAVEPSVV